MLVRMKRHITGTRDGVEWPEIGGTIDVPDHEAADLIAAGHAESTDDPRPEPASEEPAGNDDAASADDADEAPAADAVKPKRARAAKKAAS